MTTRDRITLAFATGNPHKLRELRSLLADLPVDVLPASDLLGGKPFHVVEDGATFEANAAKKGRALAELTGLLTVADDSGLEVDALNGRPGVRSARFAHDRATDAENNAALLAALEQVDDPGRTARFRCVLALFDPWATAGRSPFVVEGRCEGRIARSARGAGGFGYDPLFLVTDRGGRAMAELSDDEKNVVSHRGRALVALLPTLREFVAARRDDVERVSVPRPTLLRGPGKP